MARVSSTAVLSVLLIAALVMCPYSCAHYPRRTEHARTKLDTSGGCGCCCSESRAPEKNSREERPVPEEPCSCICICKGALSEFPGQVTPADLASPDWGAIALCNTAQPAVVLAEAWPDQPETPPPQTPTGREIRALFESLLL